MKRESKFYKLPLRFDAVQLKQELSQFGERDWIGAAGNASIIFVSVGGTFNNDFSISGQMEHIFKTLSLYSAGVGGFRNSYFSLLFDAIDGRD